MAETTSGETAISILQNAEDECLCGSAHCKELRLSQELDTILDPTSVYRSNNQIEKIWNLLTKFEDQGNAVDKSHYLELLSEYKTESHCGLAWPPCYVAYRCRTCSAAPTMALCAECFRDGDHQGHDYNMFKSRSGGACDCGYAIVEESGHCKRHGKNSKAKRSGHSIPESLICIPKRSMPRLIHRLAVQLRRSFVDLLGETELYLDFLNQLVNSCAIMRDLMIDALISEDVYSSQIKLLANHQDREVAKTINEGLKKLKRERKGLLPFSLPKDFSTQNIEIHAFRDDLTPRCFIDELIFWIVVFEFPQKLVCFLLGFLMDDKYKQIFSRAFVRQYPRILMITASSKSEPRVSRHLRDSYEQLSRRIMQISVQIYNDSDLTKRLCEEEYTLHTIIYCLKVAIEGLSEDGLSGVLKFNPLCEGKNYTQVICCDNPIIRDRHLSSFTEDLNAILAFSHEAHRLVGDKNLLDTWMRMLSYFQTMSPYKRELTEHTPYETGPHVSVFSIEADFCLAPLHTILDHLEDQNSIHLSHGLLQSIYEELLNWLDRMAIHPRVKLDPYHMSFHIPLHRMLAATLRHLLFVQKRTDSDVYNTIQQIQWNYDKTYYPYLGSIFQMLIKHPLQALTLYHETRTNMWTRNGLITINQSATYVHCGYCYSTIDLDMFLLRYSASKLVPADFLKILMSRFHAWKWLSYKSNVLMNNHEVNYSRHFNILPEQIIMMVESSLLVIIQLLTLSLNCNVTEREQTRQEMIAIISVLDRSYSYLTDMVPSRGTVKSNSVEDELISLLEELTDYKPAQHGIGGNLQQGCYTLKPNVWDDEYNPIQVQYRFYQKRDFQMSLERFFQQAKLRGKLEKRHLSSSLWPPLKIPREIGSFGWLDLSPVLECTTLAGIIYSILYKNLYIADVPDVIMAYTIHLLELSLRKVKVPSSQSRYSLIESFSFRGKYGLRELASSPSYFGSKGEANIKGSNLYAKPKHEQSQGKHHLFPVVRLALDLAFAATWFPFECIIDNCLVHIGTVYSMSSQEFDSLLHHEDKDTPPETQQETATNSSADETAKELMLVQRWPHTEDDTDDDSEDEEFSLDMMVDVSDEDDDNVDNDDNGADADEDYDRIPAIIRRIVRGNGRTLRFEHGSSMSEEESDLTQAEVNNASSLTSDERRTRDRSTNTGMSRNNSHTPQPNLRSSTQNLNHPTDTGSSDTNLHRRRPGETSHVSEELQLVQTSVANHAEALSAITSAIIEAMQTGNVVDDVEMTSDTNTRSEDEASSVPLPSTRSLQHNASNPGSMGEAGMETSMEVDSLPESHSSALSLIPFQPQQTLTQPDVQSDLQQQPQLQPQQQSQQLQEQQPQTHGRSDSTSQVYPENLVTERRAILASDPRPMITSSSQALVSDISTESSPQELTTSAEQQALSETDIQARFMGFFQSRVDSRQSSRGFRQRQMARRGGFRGPVPPFAVHNPNTHRSTARNVTIQLRDDNDMYIRPRATARRSNACTLLNRVLSNRLQPEQRPRKDNKKDMMQHNESILSLLLRLHSKYSQKARSYEYDEQRAKSNSRSDRPRIGDGVHFVTIVLDLICTLDQTMRFKLSQLQELLWPNNEITSEAKASFGGNKTEASGSTLSVAERRHRAKELQLKLIAEFANKQKAFIEKHEANSQTPAHGKKLESSTSDDEPINLSSKTDSEVSKDRKQCIQDYDKMTTSSNKDIKLDCKLPTCSASTSQNEEKDDVPTYECCICGVEGPSDLANPLGQVVLLQSTSIYGHSHLRSKVKRMLPCEESEHQQLKEETYAKYLEHRIDLLCEHFSESSWLDSINIGAEGGVHVQSCGHYVHIECHQSYIKSLDQEDRIRSRGDSDEFLCPVCRQLANSVLPILSNAGRPKLKQALMSGLAVEEVTSHEAQIRLVRSLLEHRLPPNPKELQSSATFCSHLTKATGPQYRLIRSTASMHSLFLFLTSICRTNLECEIIVRSTCGSNSRRSCFQLLFHVLALNAQTLINDQWFTCDEIWSRLTSCFEEKNRLTVKPVNREVPLLLRDPTAMLLQFLFAITSSLCHKANFTCLVQMLFNLTVVQSTALVLSYLRPGLIDKTPSNSLDSLAGVISAVGQCLAQLLGSTKEEPLMNTSVRKFWSVLEQENHKFENDLLMAENRIKLACLQFLRACAFIQHQLYNQDYPNLVIKTDDLLTDKDAIEADFTSLIRCLNVYVCKWPSFAGEEGGQKLISSWSSELLQYGAEYSILTRTLLVCRSISWYRPSLMQLPKNFDDIFMFYYKKKCSLCQQIPKDVAICLVCGAPICFRVSCCKDRSRSRQVHSQHCGANTAVFLAVHTSSIVVIRGNRACVWGSVYLDAHDEEDNGLQRGKPLYLVQARYNLLEEQWLSHSFDHTCGKRWIFLQENQ